MHKSSGCAGDGKLTVSTHEPHQGIWSMEGMYMAILPRCSLDHKSIPQLIVVDDRSALPPLFHGRNWTPTGHAVEEGVNEDMAVMWALECKKMVAVGHLVRKCNKIICSVHRGGHPTSHYPSPELQGVLGNECRGNNCLSPFSRSSFLIICLGPLFS